MAHSKKEKSISKIEGEGKGKVKWWEVKKSQGCQGGVRQWTIIMMVNKITHATDYNNETIKI